MKIYLDDERPCPEGWFPIKTSAEAISILKGGEVTDVSLDHDLGDGDVGNDYEVICFIEETTYFQKDWNVPNITIHTSNSGARVKMEAALSNIQKINTGRS